MIALLEGIVNFKTDNTAVLRCQDIGYELYIPQKKLISLELGQKYLFYIYHHITESSQLLFGFDSAADRQLFVQLISVSGVGPKTAVQFFDHYHNQEIINIIINDDLPAINKISGIGKKTAERIILELKDKLIKIYGAPAPGSNNNRAAKGSPKISTSNREDIISAFLGLGYQRKQLDQLIDQHEDELSSHTKVEESIRFLLGKL